jgi:hypothetical protein
MKSAGSADPGMSGSPPAHLNEEAAGVGRLEVDTV